MTLLQEFYPMPLDVDLSKGNSTSLTIRSVLVWNGWQLRSLSIEDINRGYVLTPTPFSREIVDYVIRNKEQIQQVQERYLYFLRIDNPSQLWPPPVELPEELTFIIPLPRLYGKLIAETIDAPILKSLGTRGRNWPRDLDSDSGVSRVNPYNGRDSIGGDPSTILADYPIHFYGVGGIIDPDIPFSSRYGIPKRNSPFVLSFGENSVERIIYDFGAQRQARDTVSITWTTDPRNRESLFYRNGVRDTTKSNIPFADRRTGINQWLSIVNETFSPNTEDYILLLQLESVWQSKQNIAKDLEVPFRFCPILRIRLGDIEHQIYLGDLGYFRSVVTVQYTGLENTGLFRWPMVLPASTEDQQFTVDVLFPELPENERDYPNVITAIKTFVYNLRTSKSLIKESLLWNDLTVWPQGPPTANVLGTLVRVPKSSTYKGKDHLITIPDGWSLSDGFDYLRTSDPVWISIDILLRSGIPITDIDFTSAVTASKNVKDFVGVIVDDVLNVFDELPVKPRFVNGLWVFSSEDIRTISLSEIQNKPKISITKPAPAPRSIGVPYKPMKFIEVKRDSNPPGYQTIHIVDTLDESEAIKEGRRYLWPETSYTLQIVLSNSIDVLVDDYIIIPETNRQWKVESIKRSSITQEITASWTNPRRERYIETGSEDPITDDFIDDWGFLDEHGFVFD